MTSEEEVPVYEIPVNEYQQYWHCEDEQCWRDISGEGERFECVGCQRWFCLNCSRSFTAGCERACRDCMGVWLSLCRVRGLHHLTGVIRPADYDEGTWRMVAREAGFRGLIE